MESSPPESAYKVAKGPPDKQRLPSPTHFWFDSDEEVSDDHLLHGKSPSFFDLTTAAQVFQSESIPQDSLSRGLLASSLSPIAAESPVAQSTNLLPANMDRETPPPRVGYSGSDLAENRNQGERPHSGASRHEHRPFVPRLSPNNRPHDHPIGQRSLADVRRPAAGEKKKQTLASGAHKAKVKYTKPKKHGPFIVDGSDASNEDESSSAAEEDDSDNEDDSALPVPPSAPSRAPSEVSLRVASQASSSTPLKVSSKASEKSPLPISSQGVTTKPRISLSRVQQMIAKKFKLNNNIHSQDKGSTKNDAPIDSSATKGTRVSLATGPRSRNSTTVASRTNSNARLARQHPNNLSGAGTRGSIIPRDHQRRLPQNSPQSETRATRTEPTKVDPVKNVVANGPSNVTSQKQPARSRQNTAGPIPAKPSIPGSDKPDGSINKRPLVPASSASGTTVRDRPTERAGQQLSASTSPSKNEKRGFVSNQRSTATTHARSSISPSHTKTGDAHQKPSTSTASRGGASTQPAPSKPKPPSRAVVGTNMSQTAPGRSQGASKKTPPGEKPEQARNSTTGVNRSTPAISKVPKAPVSRLTSHLQDLLAEVSTKGSGSDAVPTNGTTTPRNLQDGNLAFPRNNAAPTKSAPALPSVYDGRVSAPSQTIRNSSPLENVSVPNPDADPKSVVHAKGPSTAGTRHGIQPDHQNASKPHSDAQRIRPGAPRSLPAVNQPGNPSSLPDSSEKSMHASAAQPDVRSHEQPKALPSTQVKGPAIAQPKASAPTQPKAPATLQKHASHSNTATSAVTEKAAAKNARVRDVPTDDEFDIYIPPPPGTRRPLPAPTAREEAGVTTSTPHSSNETVSETLTKPARADIPRAVPGNKPNPTPASTTGSIGAAAQIFKKAGYPVNDRPPVRFDSALSAPPTKGSCASTPASVPPKQTPPANHNQPANEDKHEALRSLALKNAAMAPLPGRPEARIPKSHPQPADDDRSAVTRASPIATAPPIATDKRGVPVPIIVSSAQSGAVRRPGRVARDESPPVPSPLLEPRASAAVANVRTEHPPRTPKAKTNKTTSQAMTIITPKPTSAEVAIPEFVLQDRPIVGPRTEPYFEYRVNQKVWPEPCTENDTQAMKIGFASTVLETANKQAEELFTQTKAQFAFSLPVQHQRSSSTQNDEGCLELRSTLASMGWPVKQIHLKIWVERVEIPSAVATLSPPSKSTPFLSRTLYILRLYKLAEVPKTSHDDSEGEDEGEEGEVEEEAEAEEADSDSDASCSNSDSSSPESDADADKHKHNKKRQAKEALKGTPPPKRRKPTPRQTAPPTQHIRQHQPIPCPEVYTTLFCANNAACNLQMEMMHEENPSSQFQIAWQRTNAAELRRKLVGLRGKEGDEGHWKSTFNVGLGSNRFELVVEKVGVCGPRNV